MAIYLPAATGYAWEKAKSKPVSSRGGRQSPEEGGLGASATISLMEGVLPSMLWQLESSRSRGALRRHAWLHARAWRSSDGSRLW